MAERSTPDHSSSSPKQDKGKEPVHEALHPDFASFPPQWSQEQMAQFFRNMMAAASPAVPPPKTQPRRKTAREGRAESPTKTERTPVETRSRRFTGQRTSLRENEATSTNIKSSRRASGQQKDHRSQRQRRFCETEERKAAPVPPDTINNIVKTMQELQNEIKQLREHGTKVAPMNDPFTQVILDEPVEKPYQPLRIKPYKGVTDPRVHWNNFLTSADLTGASRNLQCRMFPLTLEGAARDWFYQLETGSIPSLEELGKKFSTHFRTMMTKAGTMRSLMHMQQGESESLCDYFSRWNRERMKTSGIQEQAVVPTFELGVRNQELADQLTMTPPESLGELQEIVQQFINLEQKREQSYK